MGYGSPQLEQTVFDVGLDWAATDHLTLGASYLRLDGEDGAAINDLRGSVTLGTDLGFARPGGVDLGAFTSDLRQILEHRVIENGVPDQTRYRPRLRVSCDLQGLLTGATGPGWPPPLTAFAYWEPFFDPTEGTYDRQWLSAGLRLGLTERWAVQAQYIRQEEDPGGTDLDAVLVGLHLWID